MGEGGDEHDNSITSANLTKGNGEEQFRTTETKQGKGEREASQHGTVEHIPSASSGATTTESNLQQLISKCQAALADYDKLYFEFEVVASKEDIDKQGQARVKVAAADLSKQALKLSRFCMSNLANLSVACMEEAKTAFFECKWEREFANDACPQMSFSGRQLTGECVI